MAVKFSRCARAGKDECHSIHVGEYIFYIAWLVFAALFGVQVYTNIKGKHFSDAEMERGYYEDEEEYLRGDH